MEMALELIDDLSMDNGQTFHLFVPKGPTEFSPGLLSGDKEYQYIEHPEGVE